MAARKIKKFTPRAQKETSKEEPDLIEFEIWDEVYYARESIPGIFILNFIAASSEQDETSVASLVRELKPFLKASLVTESYNRFIGLLQDPDRRVDIDEIMEVVGYLIEQYSEGKPTSGSAK